MKLALTGLMVLALAGCSKPDKSIEMAKAALEQRLKDPASVQYKDVQAFTEGVVCGAYNAKNAMGGYVGFKPFIYNGLVRNGLSESPRADEVEAFCNQGNSKRLAYLEAELGKKKKRLDELQVRANATCTDFDCRSRTDTAQKLLEYAQKSFAEDEAKVAAERERSSSKKP